MTAPKDEGWWHLNREVRADIPPTHFDADDPRGSRCVYGAPVVYKAHRIRLRRGTVRRPPAALVSRPAPGPKPPVVAYLPPPEGIA